MSTLARDTTTDAQSVNVRIESGVVPSEVSGGAVAALLGPGWVGDLTAFQSRDVAHLLSLRHGANFSVPGAGKTRVGLAVYDALRTQREVSRLLIVGPKSCYEAWQSEADVCFAQPPRVHVLDQHVDAGAEVLIVNYERLQAHLPALSRWLSSAPSLLILDEAHRMKLGTDGAYGSACLALGPRAKRRMILTGTPAPNGARDLETLMSFVWPGYGRRVVTQALGGGDLKQASVALRPLFTRTSKSELNLPPVSVVRRELPLPPVHREIYDALLGQYSARSAVSQDDFRSLGKIIVYLLMAAISPALLAVGTTRYEPLAYQVPPLPVPKNSSLMGLMKDLPSYEMSPKYMETLAIVAENAALGRKTLVWSTFIRSARTLEQMLKEYRPALVHGGSDDRAEQIDRFRNDPDCMVLISNPATLGEGISLHHQCHDAVYVDRDFAAGRFLQSLDRIHRLGLSADTETRITVLTSKETIDDVVNQRLEAKLTFMGQILDDRNVQQLADLEEEPSVGGGLEPADFQALMGHLRASPL
ncbi:DEAD/DEAH box helicase [Arthrobacter crusticola]|nr:DEAD/DEAH box helicase [Arthrobacter crusticola]